MKQSLFIRSENNVFYKGENEMGNNDFNSFLKEVVTTEFFTNICEFTKEEREQKENWIALTKAMLLLDAYSDSKWKSKELSDASLIVYLAWARENYDDCKINTIKSVVEYLEDAFVNTKMRIKKEDIPELIKRAATAMYEEVEPKTFCDMWKMEKNNGINTKAKTSSKRL